MNLKERIDEYKKKSAGKATEEMQTIMKSATDAVRDSLAGRKIPAKGDTFPDFSLIGSQGNPVDSTSLRGEGALVITLFRGMW